MKPANYAPLYQALGLYPKLSELFRTHGYALAVHGSMGRDFDLIAVPWIEEASEPDEVVKDIVSKFAFKQVLEPDIVEHGRKRYDLHMSFGECYIDLSFTPKMKQNEVYK